VLSCVGFIISEEEFQMNEPVTGQQNTTVAGAADAPAHVDPRATHEAAEAQRKAEWDAAQAEKKEALDKAVADIQAMSDEAAIAAAVKRLEDDADRITRRNMKLRIAEHIQSMCRTNSAFARLTMQPRKTTINCFKFIQRHAVEHLKKTNAGTDGGDVPDDLCFKWASDYYLAADAEEDKCKDDTFEPKKFYGNEANRAAHDAAEAERKAKWDAKRKRKAEAEAKELENMLAMSGEDVAAAAAEKIGTDVRLAFEENMMICFAKHLQGICQTSPSFARTVMHPSKTMANCEQYVKRPAMEYLRDEAEANGQDGRMPYGSVPNGICYKWAVEYFNDPDAEEDKDEEFVPKPFYGSSSSSKKKAPPKKKEPPVQQASLAL
jgi:hypothetical protein